MGKDQGYSKHESDQSSVCPPSSLFRKYYKQKPNKKHVQSEPIESNFRLFYTKTQAQFFQIFAKLTITLTTSLWCGVFFHIYFETVAVECKYFSFGRNLGQSKRSKRSMTNREGGKAKTQFRLLK